MGRSQRGERSPSRRGVDSRGEAHFPGAGVAADSDGHNPATQPGSATAYTRSWSTWPSARIQFTLVTDNLNQLTPEVVLDSTEAGTVTFDFDASDTPPAKGAGSIGTGSFTIPAGQSTQQPDLSPFPSATGYVHFRLTVGNFDSEPLTSQQITTPA